MKKQYIKPSVEIENIIMDIAFAGSCASQNMEADKEAARKTFESNPVMGFDSFDAYWSFLTNDDTNSGNCYFTLSTPVNS